METAQIPLLRFSRRRDILTWRHEQRQHDDPDHVHAEEREDNFVGGAHLSSGQMDAQSSRSSWRVTAPPVACSICTARAGVMAVRLLTHCHTRPTDTPSSLAKRFCEWVAKYSLSFMRLV